MVELVPIRTPRSGLLRTPLVQLVGLPRAELERWFAENVGGPRYRAVQAFEWLHRHRVGSFEPMSNLGLGERRALAERASLLRLKVDAVACARDGTRKLRLRTLDGHAIECVLIPNEGRGATLCVSSMVGCSLTCQFCATATLGFVRNLNAWEIVDQVYHALDLIGAQREGADEVHSLTNLVFMGMGEPLHNIQQVRRAIAVLTDPKGAAIAGRRITISTAGLVPAIERFARDELAHAVGLAISLNATTDEVRDRIMPINRKWPIARLLAAARQVPTARRSLTFEYVLLEGVNDDPRDARRLAALVRGFDCQINVIPFNPHPSAHFSRPSEARIRAFMELARDAGLRVYLRSPRGDDIAAACGQLAIRDPGAATG